MTTQTKTKKEMRKWNLLEHLQENDHVQMRVSRSRWMRVLCTANWWWERP